MKLLMAVSSDGFVATGPADDMSWTGPIDKAVFRLLTSTGDILAVSAKSLQSMPETLPGRGRVYAVSTDPLKGVSLQDLAPIAPDAWLLGGQELGLYALKNGFATKAYICISPAMVGDGLLGAPGPGVTPEHIPDKLQPYFNRRTKAPGRGSWWEKSSCIKVGDVVVDIWDRHSAIDGESADA